MGPDQAVPSEWVLVFGIGSTEFVIILVLVLLFFGPDKLPQLARTFGRFMREFKRAQDTMEATIRAEMYKVDNPQLVEQAETVAEAEAQSAHSKTAAIAVDEDGEEEDEE